MKNKILVLVLLMVSLSVFFIIDVNAEINGCYYIEEQLLDISSKKKLLAKSWIKIEKKEKSRYLVRGELTGANFDICTIEGESGAIEMKLKDNILSYHTEVEYYDGKRSCNLRFEFLESKFIIRENNKSNEDEYNCSVVVFACGSHIILDEYEFPFSSKTKSETCDALIK